MATQPRSSKPGKPRQARGMSLHIGINEVQAAAYVGWTGPLAACEFDANDLAALASVHRPPPTEQYLERFTGSDMGSLGLPAQPDFRGIRPQRCCQCLEATSRVPGKLPK